MLVIIATTMVMTMTHRVGRKLQELREALGITQEELAKSMAGEQWSGGEPGNFIVIYRVTSGRVTSFIVAAGNNP